jgi:hypothetical protein
MLYMLPTKADRRYRGRYPNAIHSYSLGSTDIDGARCISFETNCGERFTCSYDRLDHNAFDGQARRSVNWMDIVRGGTVVIMMRLDQYGEWLTRIRDARNGEKV